MEIKEKTQIGLIVNGPNILVRRFNLSLEEILEILRKEGRIAIGKVILNHNATPKLIEAVVNYGLEPVIVNGRVDVAVAVESMKLLYNPGIDVIALGVRDTHFMPILFEARKVGKKVIVIAPEEGLSEAIQNTADKVIKITSSSRYDYLTTNFTTIRV